MALAAPEHQEMNTQVKVTCITLSKISQSLMVHVIFLEAYIYFALMYTTDNMFLVLPINEYDDPTTIFKVTAGTKASVSHLRLLFCPYVVGKATEDVGTKALNMRHQAQKVFCSIFVGI